MRRAQASLLEHPSAPFSANRRMARRRAALRRLAAAWRAEDIRFADAAQEAGFRASLEWELICWVFGLSILTAVVDATLLLLIYIRERRREDAPFVWNLSDPRILVFVAGIENFVAPAITVAFSAVRLFSQRLLSWNWELIATGLSLNTIAATFGFSSWHTTQVVGADQAAIWKHDTRSSEIVSILVVLLVTITVTTCVPIRSCILWMVPLFTSLYCLLIAAIVGSPFPDASIRVTFFVVLICAFAHRGAHRNEQYVREKWLAVQLVADQKLVARGLHAMAGTVSDVVIQLGPDLRIVQSNHMHDAFFGRSVQNELLPVLLAEADRHAFHASLARASESQALESMPASLMLEHAEMKVQLVMVDTHCKSPRYLVGVQQVELVPSCSVGVAIPMPLSSMQLAHGARSVVRDDTVTAISLPSTSGTENVFKDPGTDTKRLLKTLEQMAEIGVKEHWLVNIKDVALLPEVVLGSGGFGLVVMGRLHGTPVAVKLPKRFAGSGSAQYLNSLFNELRVHRLIRHVNIVAFRGACIDPDSGEIAVLSEYVPGVTMDNFVRHEMHEQCQAPDLVRQKLLLDVASALTYCHNLKPVVVHGDVKPTNIIVEQGASPRAKLLDFGLSRLLTKRAQPLRGTARWRAPELRHPISSRPETSADVFSFGLLAEFVATGDSPQSTQQESDVKSESMFVLNEFPNLCEQCLRIDPSTRPSMLHVLDMLCGLPPLGGENLESIGPEVRALLAPGASWAEGVKIIRDRPEPIQVQEAMRLPRPTVVPEVDSSISFSPPSDLSLPWSL